ncbi:hypothetical protein [Clostridium psychrophilum]|uniref:hypothetical protein n=1 Tax=Clostridium psychrophilum TaxID=132926 RepID=UPI001C0B440D|nr:hypothetical protein [Clostridium psychrophilum]MBU3181882.1 hypothetical protein [Clostridium psychrophilum]
MKKVGVNLLGIYDMILAFGAIYIGVDMSSSNSQMFIQYPREWLAKVPFGSWVTPGLIAIVLFGLGNLLAAIFCLKKENSKSWVMSVVMGGILFISLITQIMILGEWYLATVELLLLSIVQLWLSIYVFKAYKYL